MTKKDYEAVAELYYSRYEFLTKHMHEAKDDGFQDAKAYQLWNEIENTKSLMFDIMRIFRDSNPKFDWFKFLAITGLSLNGNWAKR